MIMVTVFLVFMATGVMVILIMIMVIVVIRQLLFLDDK